MRTSIRLKPEVRCLFMSVVLSIAANYYQSRQLPADQLAHAGQEVGDIVLYLLLLCSELGLDMNEVVRSKLADSERRFSR